MRRSVDARRVVLALALCAPDTAYAQVEPSQGATYVVVLGSLTMLAALGASALVIAAKLAELRERRRGASAKDLDPRVEARLSALERQRDADETGQFVAVQSEATVRARLAALERRVAQVTAALRHSDERDEKS